MFILSSISFSRERELKRRIFLLTGIRPLRIRIYKEAFTHSSAINLNQKPNSTTKTINNERLEFLGDAILDAVVAEVLFNRFPFRDEGFLTEMRTRIVNREQMGDLAFKMGLTDVMDMKSELLKNPSALKGIGGNALEALIGAIYLDRGYKKASWFVRHRLIGLYLDIDKLMLTAVSHKAVFIKWVQKNQKVLEWKYVNLGDEKKEKHEVSLWVDNEFWYAEINKSRKKAEELCCEKACRRLEINHAL